MHRRLLRSLLVEETTLELTTRWHIMTPFREDLERSGYITSRTLRCRSNGRMVKVAGKVVLIHTPPTRSGIRVMFVTLEDEFGLIDLAVFPKAQERYAKVILSSPILLVSGKVRRLGARDISLVVSEVQTLKALQAIFQSRTHSLFLHLAAPLVTHR